MATILPTVSHSVGIEIIAIVVMIRMTALDFPPVALEVWFLRVIVILIYCSFISLPIVRPSNIHLLMKTYAYTFSEVNYLKLSKLL